MARFGEPGELGDAVRRLATVLQTAAGPDGDRVWTQVAADQADARRAARQGRSRAALLVWGVLLAGPFAYFVVGGVPQWSGVQTWLSASPGFWALLALAVAGMAWTAWRLHGTVLAWPRVRELVTADVPAGVVLAVGTQVAALGIGAVSVYLAARGTAGDAKVVSNFHILDAISSVLLVGGVALMLLAIAADPPLALVVLAGGGSTWLWTGITAATADALITGGAVAATGAGIHYMTGDNGGGPGGSDASPAEPMPGGERPPSNPMDIVPENASKRVLRPDPGSGVQEGVEYKWVDDQGQTVRLRIHGSDGTAPPGSNSASGTTYRIQVGGRYMDADGNLYPRGVSNPASPNYDPAAANATHIPWPSDLPIPW